MKTGGHGSTISITKEFAQSIANKYSKKIDFHDNDNYLYRTAYRHGWLDDICSHLDVLKTTIAYTKEECQEVASKYDAVLDFKLNDRYVYNYSRKNGFYTDITTHMRTISN